MRLARAVAAVLLACLPFPSRAVAAEPLGVAIVTQERAILRAAPRAAAPVHATLLQGETVEVRGRRLDYLQVYDHKRERAGYLHASQARQLALLPDEAPELLAVLRFLRSSPGAEALGIAFAAAYIKAAPAEALNGEAGVEALDALGTLAERLAQRATAGSASAQLEVAARYGVAFASRERAGRIVVCYDGEAFRRVLAMRSRPEQRARAALALTREECLPGEPGALGRDQWRAEVLDRVDSGALSGYLKNRVLLRRAGVWAGLAYRRAREGEPAASAAQRAIAELASIDKSELADADARAYSEAAVRVGASRWAAVASAAAAEGKGPHLMALPGRPGETCVLLVNAAGESARPLAKRCTYGIAWLASATLNREGTALVLAVQMSESWREMWVFRKAGAGWTARVLPPGTMPGLGYVEFAGWVPGGTQLLVAREARGENGYQRSFELLRLDTLATVRRGSSPGMLGAFQRWQDPYWKSQTLSLR